MIFIGLKEGLPDLPCPTRDDLNPGPPQSASVHGKMDMDSDASEPNEVNVQIVQSQLSLLIYWLFVLGC